MSTVLGPNIPDVASAQEGSGGPAYYSVAEAAALLGVSRVTIWRWVRAGRLPIWKLGHRTARVKRADLEQLAAERTGARTTPLAPHASDSLPDQDDAVDSADLDHIVQFYAADSVLMQSVAEYLGAGLRAGGAAIVIATEAHRAGVEDRLHQAGLDVAAVRAAGRYLSLNAAETLASISPDGEVSAPRFVEVIGGVVERAAEGGRAVRIFGEMVALLLDRGDLDGVMQVEREWNALRQRLDFSLMCGYAIDSFSAEPLSRLFAEITAEHAAVMPTEEYTLLGSKDERLRAIASLQQQSRALQAEIARRTAAEERLTVALESERAARAAVERSQQRADFLSAASATLAGSLLDESTLDVVARLAVPALADWCVVDLAEGDDAGGIRLRRIAAAHADPAREPLIHALQRQYPTLEPGAAHTAMRVVETGRPWFDPAVSRERLQAEALDPAHFALECALGFSAEMVIPLIARDRTLGTITLVGADGRSFDQDDLAVAEELARRCAMAIANSLMLAAEESARRLAQQAAERTRRLQEITGQLSRSLQADDVLASIARSAADLLQAPVGAVFLLDAVGKTDDFLLAAAHGIDADRAPHLRLPRHGSLAGRAIDAGQTLVVDDVRDDDGTALPALLTGHVGGSEIAAPITSSNGSLGVVKVFSPTTRRFSADDAAMLTALAAAAAVALTNARLYREAQDAIRTRDEFLSAAAHDLKTPLTSVKGMAQLLRRQAGRAATPGSERLVEGLARIDATATKMGQQLDELLDLTRVQMGQQLELRTRPTDLVDLARRMAGELQEVRERHEIRVETGLDRLVGRWDAVRLSRVLENLLSNAIKYSPNGGEVAVRVAQEERDGVQLAALSVTDQGLGVPAADLPLIFERFQRARNVEGRIGGTGIGLASARQIVEQHGGTISATSQEGVGSTFTVLLPLDPAQATGEPTRTEA
jgi:excisionase family DNA binding protein